MIRSEKLKEPIYEEEPSRYQKNEQRREERGSEPLTGSLPPPPAEIPPKHAQRYRGYHEDMEMENLPYSGVINAIAGGPTGGDSRNARERTAQHLRSNDRSYAPSALKGTNAITFDDSEIPPPTSGGGDLKDPDVPLVVSLVIATYKVNKVLVDTGSSFNVISKRTMEQMHLGCIQYGRVYTSLVGFGGSVVRPIGSIPLQVSMGTFPTRVIETILFVVVDSTFDYNVILGHPGLNQFRAIASPLHNRVKFPTPNGVGEEVGNVREACECYIMSTR